MKHKFLLFVCMLCTEVKGIMQELLNYRSQCVFWWLLYYGHVWSPLLQLFITITIAAILKAKHLYDLSVSDNIQPLLLYGVTVLWVILVLVSKWSQFIFMIFHSNV